MRFTREKTRALRTSEEGPRSSGSRSDNLRAHFRQLRKREWEIEIETDSFQSSKRVEEEEEVEPLKNE